MIRRATRVRCTILSASLIVAGMANAATGTGAAHLATKAKTGVRHAHLAVGAHAATLHNAGHTVKAVVRAVAKTHLILGANGRMVRVVLKHPFTERFYASSFADDVTSGDVTDGEDPVVRAAAIQALGNMNGTAVAIDPSTGRILAMVNQKLALSNGAEPCSTIKLTVALAALQEGIITRETPVALGSAGPLEQSLL
jgi:penicillin-binding protein 2